MNTYPVSSPRRRGSSLIPAFAGMTLSLFLIASLSIAAERSEPVQATARVLKPQVKIGDEIRLLITVEHPRKFSITPLSEKIDVSPFEVKKMDPPVRKGSNRVQEIYGFTLTVFELGDLKIPSVPVSYQNESNRPGEVRTDAVPVKIVSVGKKLTDKDDVRPIKGPVSLGLLRFRTVLFGILAAILCVFLIIKVTRRWLRRQKELESRKPPHVRARLELERLKSQGLLEDKKVKEYYSGLSDILRNYMERAMKLEALERTTFEVLQEMKEKNHGSSLVEKIKHVLEETDLVKFAKNTPERTTADQLEREILDIVEATEPKGHPRASGDPLDSRFRGNDRNIR